MTFQLWRSSAALQLMLVGALPLLILTAVVVKLIQPRMQERTAAQARIAKLEQHILRMRATVTGGAEVDLHVDPLKVFEIRAPATDRMPELLAHIRQQLAGTNGERVRNVKIEIAERVSLVLPATGQGSRTASDSGGAVDPRLAVFPAPLSYTPVSISFDGSYARVGRFLWELRWLPTLVEVRSLEVGPAPDASLIRCRLLLAVFQRVSADQQGQRRQLM